MRCVIPTVILLVIGTVAAASDMPDPGRTPGRVRPLSKDRICVIQWGRDARHVTEAMKEEVAEAYHLDRDKVVGREHGPCCEYDHLISRELGGADEVTNLWPQPWAEATKKDQLENLLHRLVCANKVPLRTAQHAIAEDWVRAYTKYYGHAPF